MNRVVIVGAGVTGLSTAYHLAKKQFGEIVLIDKSQAGDGSSQRAAGIITGLLWNEPGVLVRKRCLALFQAMSQELDGYRFRSVGCLSLFSKESWPDREALLPMYDRLDVPYRVLSTGEITKRWPELHIPHDVMGLYDPLGGYSEPSEYIPALKLRVLELGVDVLENEQAVAFELNQGAVTGVRTENRLIEADVVVSTVYSWTRVLLHTVALDLAVKCFVHQRYVTTPLRYPLNIPAVNANPFGVYFRPATGGRLLAGIESNHREDYSVESLKFNQSELPSPGLNAELRGRVLPLLPSLEDIQFEIESVGLLTFSMDGEPILGPLDELPGLILGLAFHSGGFAYNPGTGELLADYVCNGKTSIDVTSWSPNRFNRADTNEYLARKMRQSEIVLRRH